MLTITNCGYRHGYSGEDHLLDDSEFQPAIGRDFRSLRDASRAINRMASRAIPIWVEYRVAGEIRKSTI